MSENDGMTQLPDDSGCYSVSWPLPKEHWLYNDVENDGKIETHLKLAIKGATADGTIFDFDPDALIQNFKAIREKDAVKQSFDTIKEAINNDYDYAWSWHCNVAVCSMDEGLPHDQANKAAARFMSIAFGVDTSHPPKGKEENDITEEEAKKLMESYKQLHSDEVIPVVSFTEPVSDIE